MKLLTQNSKLKKTSKKTGYNIFNFGITAIKTCPSALQCISDCYAQQGAYRWTPVKNAYAKRYEVTKSNAFIEEMHKAIDSKRTLSHVRIHDSGDFYSREYLNKWIDIMYNNPHITFYAYTKEVELFKAYEAILPDNFIYIFSFGGKHDALIDKENDRHAMVFESLDDMPNRYINASENDLNAITGNLNVGLIYHGQSKIKGFKKVVSEFFKQEVTA